MNASKNHEEGGVEKADSMSMENVGAKLSIHQPEPMTNLLDLLSSFDSISERIGEDRSGDLGGAGAGAGSSAHKRDDVSLRDKAIASLPSVPAMRHRLTGHLQKDARHLERKAKRLARNTKKGSAYMLNEMYARIRKMQKLIVELVDATADTVKRLYVRLFVDNQKIV